MTFRQMYQRWGFAKIVGLALLTAAMSYVTVTHFMLSGRIGILWLPGGIAFAAIMIGGQKYWPGVFLGAFLGGVLIENSVYSSLLIAGGNTAEPVVAAWLLRRNRQFRITLKRSRDFLLLLPATILGAIVSAAFGVTTLWYLGFVSPERLPLRVLDWVFGDAAAMLLIAPLIILGWQQRQTISRSDSLAEGIACVMLTLLLGHVLFMGWWQGLVHGWPLDYFAFLVVIWAGLRLGRFVTLLVVTIMALLGQWGVVKGLSVFSSAADSTALLNFWLFIAVLTVVGVLLAVTIHARKESEALLRRSTKMDAMGQLTGGIAHDYNNMLGIVLGFTDLLRAGLRDDPHRLEQANQIKRAAERGVELTRKLLSFSRHQASDAEVVDLNQVLLDARPMLEKTLTARIMLELVLADRHCNIRLNRGDLEDAVVNLCINSQQAMPDGGRLCLATSQLRLNRADARELGLEPGRYVRLSVQDTGSGMDEETRSQVFDPFFTTKGDKGTGLGLSQVYGFVQRSGGGIQILSEPGSGTEVEMYFPQLHSGSETNAVKSVESSTHKGRGTESILVVDDETALLEIAQEILSSYGYTVILAESPRHALVELERQSIDLVLTDIIMPDMDGHSLAEEAQRRYPQIRVLLCTGFSDDVTGGSATSHASRQILQKPYSAESLLQAVQDALEPTSPG